MSRKEEEYLKRQRELGYEPSLDGLDEEDFDYVPSWSSKNPNRPPAQELAREYRPVDRDFAERILRMFKRPFDPNWQMPDLDGPEYRQPPKPEEWFDPKKVKTLPYIPGEREPRIWAEPYKPGSGRIVPFSYGMGGDTTGLSVQPASANAGQEGVGMQARSWRGGDMPSRAGSDRQEALRRYGEMQNTYKEPQYKQGWLDENVWKSPEVQNAGTREERAAAIDRIISGPAGEDLRKHYLYNHGNENDANLARTNDVNYILDTMGGTRGQEQSQAATNRPAQESAQAIGNMTPSERLVDFIANYESFRNKQYRPTPTDYLTIGFGHVIKPGEDFSNGITEPDARKILMGDINEHADAINKWAEANNLKLSQQQFDALVSLRFNLGSLDRAPKLRGLILSGTASPDRIRREFEDIISDDTGPLEGLWQRRRDEADMYFNGDYRRKELPVPKELFPNR